jgi:hypothetical protein
VKIAARIVELSDQVLSTKENKHYIALQVGSPPNCNAVIVSDLDHVNFRIPSQDLLNRVKAEGFTPEERTWSGFFKGGLRFSRLGLDDLRAHEALFKEIIKGSIKEIEHLKGEGK